MLKVLGLVVISYLFNIEQTLFINISFIKKWKNKKAFIILFPNQK